jgi:hypothetical protein
VAQAARVVVEDVLQVGALRHVLEQLVDLLLVLDDGELDAGILQHEDHLGRHGILVHRNGHAAQALRGIHRPVQAGTVVADDGQVVAALEAQLGEAAGHGAHFLGHLRPGPGLPDAHVLLARRRMVRPHLGVMFQKARKRAERRQSNVVRH